MRFIINSDDYGRSKCITDSILHCHDQGSLNSVSLLATGDAYEYAVREYNKRSDLRLAVHIDLVEGNPISSVEKIPLLVNALGGYRYSFITLWFTYLISRKRRRQELKNQVETEINAQILKIKKSFGQAIELNLDSHMHMHMIPFVFDLIIKLANVHKVSYIRLSYEPFFINIKNRCDLRNYLGVNIIKHFLLKLLAKNQAKVLAAKGISTCDYFIGILFTGNMSLDAVEKALEKIPKVKGTTEILFHSGKALPEEGIYLARVPYIFKYYLSPNRDLEGKALCDKRLARILDNF